MRRPGDLDFAIYLRGVVVLAKTPILVVPLIAAQLVLTFLFGGSSAFDAGGGWFTGLISQIVHGFALALTLIGADLAWREQPVRMADMVEKMRRRGGDILWATFAFYFVLFIAQLLGGFLLAPFGALGFASYAFILLYAAAMFFVIYTFPAAANGGIPGQAAANESFLQARAYPLPTIAVTVVYVVMNGVLPIFAAPWAVWQLSIAFPQLAAYDVTFKIVESLVIGALGTYAAIMLARVYNDLATRRFFFSY